MAEIGSRRPPGWFRSNQSSSTGSSCSHRGMDVSRDCGGEDAVLDAGCGCHRRVLATGAVLAFASESELTYDSFAGAIGVPMTILLPVVAILSVTGEWSQRAGLTTFTLVPHRGRVIRAKLVVTLAIGVASMAVALAIGALGTSSAPP